MYSSRANKLASKSVTDGANATTRRRHMTSRDRLKLHFRLPSSLRKVLFLFLPWFEIQNVAMSSLWTLSAEPTVGCICLHHTVSLSHCGCFDTYPLCARFARGDNEKQTRDGTRYNALWVGGQVQMPGR